MRQRLRFKNVKSEMERETDITEVLKIARNCYGQLNGNKFDNLEENKFLDTCT